MAEPILFTIISAIATMIGAGKGVIDLYQGIKSLIPPQPRKILSEVAKLEEGRKYSEEKINFVYKEYETSGLYVANILSRIKSQYLIGVISLIFMWIIILLIYLFVAKHLNIDCQ